MLYIKILAFFFIVFSFSNIYAEENTFKVIHSFQQPSYLLEKETNSLTLNCDNSKNECKVNFDFRDSFTGNFKAKDFICETNFGFTTGQENKCNPNTITFPEGEHNIEIVIVNKNDESVRDILKMKIINSRENLIQNEKVEEEKKENEVIENGKEIINGGTNDNVSIEETSLVVANDNKSDAIYNSGNVFVKYIFFLIMILALTSFFFFRKKI